MQHKTMGERLKMAMKLRNIKSKDVISNVDITKGAYSSYLCDKYVPKDHILSDIADYLNVSKDWLNGISEEIENLENKLKYLTFEDLLCEVQKQKQIFLRLLETIDVLDLLYGNTDYFELIKDHIEKLIIQINSISINSFNGISFDNKNYKDIFLLKKDLIKCYLKECCENDEFIKELQNRDIYINNCFDNID